MKIYLTCQKIHVPGNTTCFYTYLLTCLSFQALGSVTCKQVWSEERNTRKKKKKEPVLEAGGFGACSILRTSDGGWGWGETLHEATVQMGEISYSKRELKVSLCQKTFVSFLTKHFSSLMEESLLSSSNAFGNFSNVFWYQTHFDLMAFCSIKSSLKCVEHHVLFYLVLI